MSTALPAVARTPACQCTHRLQVTAHHSTGGYQTGRARSKDASPAPRTLQKSGFEKIPGYGSSPGTRVLPASLELPFTLQGLVVFTAVCSHGSVEAAATALGQSASTVHFNVSQLERKLGLALLSKVRSDQVDRRPAPVALACWCSAWAASLFS